MMDKPIIESGMTFGPYPEGHSFYIEKSECYKNIQNDVKMAEFFLLQHKEDDLSKVLIIEAKSSGPAPGSKLDFNVYISDICEKFRNALMLGIAGIMERHPDPNNELPKQFKNLELSSTSFIFVLVINGHKKDWLPPVNDALNRELKPFIKVWGKPLTSVLVINEVSARDCNLIKMI